MGRGLAQMHEHYDAIVVGSGYGGGVTASRLARAGASVCVVERGKEIHPGSYPTGAASAARHVQATTARGRFGSPTALIDFSLGSDIGVVRGCGLGGTSLINANVSRRADPRVFDDDRWPAEFRNRGADVLEPYYERAEAMLGSTKPPPSVLTLPKTRALARSAAALGEQMEPARLNVTFEAGRNAAGVMQSACTLCGDCVSGCNHGAKNTVLMNYLPHAHAHGAHIVCEVGVRTVQKRDDGRWLVSFTDLSRGARRFGSPTRFVTADVVVLAAGALGSTEILLRSRAAGLETSPRLGHSFTGNGDVVAFAFDTDATLRSVGLGKRPATDSNAVGPCITGMIDVAGDGEGRPDVLIQEGSVPGATGFLAGVLWAVGALLFGDDGSTGLRRLARRLWQLARSLFGAHVGPPSRSMTYLVMSIDDDNGQLVLDGDRLDIRWPNIAKRPVFRAINDTISRAARGLGGTFVPNPMWASPLGSTLLTVQPLGGCDMGDDATHGVVDHKGRVFAGTAGTATHDGLYVADGAIVPRPLGANPSLVISALAERIAELLVTDRGYETSHAAPAPARDLRGPGLGFTERIAGHFSTKVKDGYRAGETQGRADRSPIEAVLTIDYDGLDVLGDGAAPARVTGSAFAPALSRHRLVAEGSFRLFVPDPRHVETWHMRYDLTLRGEDGERFGLRVFKLLRERGSLDAWPDTTTAYARVTDVGGRTLGVGIVRVSMRDFLRQITTVDAPRSIGARERWSVRLRYMRMFAKKLLSMYGGPLDTPGEFPSAPVRTGPVTGHRQLRLPEAEVFWCGDGGTWHEGADPDDGAWLQLFRYRGGGKGPVMLSCGFAMSSTSFLLDTVECNIVEYLTERGYDVWLFDNRGGIQLPSVTKQYSLDDVATIDWPAAVAKVREVTGAESVQVVAHCTGALTFQMAMLAGLQGVRSAVVSALTAHFSPPPLKRFLNSLGAEKLLAKLGVTGFKPYTRPTLRNQLIDVALRLYPIAREERCGQALCRWINVVYGTTHRHGQLNDATHKALHQMFGFGNFSAGRQFAAMFRAGHVLDRDGRDGYTPHPQRLAIPLLFVHGDRNAMFHPKGSTTTMRWLATHNDPSLYRRVVLRDYGHLDAFIGRDAHTDAFPVIVEHLEETASS